MSLLQSTNCDLVDDRNPSMIALPPRGMYVPSRIERAERCIAPPFTEERSDKPSPAQRTGLSYERRMKSRLGVVFGPVFEAGVWFSYIAPDAKRRRYCEVDGLVNAAPSPIVFEIKLRWMDTAWWQLQRLYGPVVSRALECFHPPSLVAVVRSFDPAVVVPGKVRLLRRVEECPYLDAGELGVLVWK